MVRPPIIHHITDLHVGPLHASPSAPSFLARKKSDVQDEAIVRYVRHLKAHAALPDLIVISGDLTSYASESEFNRIADFLDEIGTILGKSANGHPSARICVVPGNHDLDWQRPTQSEKQERFRRLCQPRSSILFSPFSNPPYAYYPDFNLLVYAFNSCPMGGINDPEVEKLALRFSAVFSQLSEFPTGDELERALADLRRLGHQDPGFITVADLEAMDEALPEGHDSMFKIAVMHHNPSLVPAKDIDQYQSIVNGGVVKHRLMKRGFDLILHGHRHFPHCSYEEYLEDKTNRKATAARYSHGLYTLGGPSLGSAVGDARWFSITIDEPTHVYELFPPASLVTVNAAQEEGGVYYLKAHASYRMPVGKKVHSDFRALQELIGRDPPQDAEMMLLRKAIDSIQLGLLDLQAKVDNWEAGESNWQNIFHSKLDSFGFIYGIDLLGPASWFNPSYLEYVAQQFAERKRRMKERKGTVEWRFSADVMRAIKVTGWRVPTGVAHKRPLHSGELEIARILIWKKSWLEQLAILKMIDRLHNLFGVPVFVLPAEVAEEFTKEEFVIALDRDRKPVDCRMYNVVKGGRTEEIPKGRTQKYLERFDVLLARGDLLSISQVIPV
jgi:3',5'-cyclic AMP phosphodiesterase CpdA